MGNLSQYFIGSLLVSCVIALKGVVFSTAYGEKKKVAEELLYGCKGRCISY